MEILTDMYFALDISDNLIPYGLSNLTSDKFFLLKKLKKKSDASAKNKD